MALEVGERSIEDIVDEVRFDTRISQKSTKPYNVLVIKLTNGYEIETFVERAEGKLIEVLLNDPTASK